MMFFLFLTHVMFHHGHLHIYLLYRPSKLKGESGSWHLLHLMDDDRCADKCHNPTKYHIPRQMSQQPSINVTANDKCHNIASTNVTANDKCHNIVSTNVTGNDNCYNIASTNVTANDKCHNIASTMSQPTTNVTTLPR